MLSRKEAQLMEDQMKKIEQIKNAAQMPHYDLSTPEEYKIEIKIDNKVEPAQFKPSQTEPGVWFANELTFRAMKKDIFLLDSAMLDLKDQVECAKCSKAIDRQFWKMCPYCAQEY